MLGVLWCGTTCRPQSPPASLSGPRFPAPATIVIAPDSGVDAVADASGEPVFPRYPVAERNAGTQAWPLVAYVVDTSGAVEVQTLTFLDPPPPFGFRQALCDWAARARFTPLRLDGHPRRALLVHPWSFEVSGGVRRPLPDPSPYRTRFRAMPPEAVAAELAILPHCP